MKKRFHVEQIISILKEAEGGFPVIEVARKHNISEATFYRWKTKYGGLNISEARRLRALEDENGRLKKKLAEAVLEIDLLKEVNSKNW